MFYVPELLTVRRHGKLAKCWLAANFPRPSFFKKYRRNTIVQINVAKTCELIITNVVSKDPGIKFSLYLSANLMLGTSRILLYQADICLEQQFDEQRRILIQLDPNDLIDEKQKRTKDLPVEDLFLLSPAEVPMADINFSTNLANEADITLIEHDMNRIYETTMQAVDQLNFGALTDQQMGEMLENNGSCLFSASSVRFVRSPEESLPAIEDIPESHAFKVPEPRERREKSRNGTEAVDRFPAANESLNDIQAPPEPVEGFSTIQVVRPLGTPTKHRLPPPSNVGTPTKRRNLGSELNSESAQVPIPDEPPRAVQVSNAALSDESLVLDSLNESLLEQLENPIKRIRKSKRVADEITKLPIEDLSFVAGNMFYQTRASAAREDIIHLPLPSAAKLLTTPSLKKPWANSLQTNYEIMILEPISQPQMNGKTRRQQGSLIRKQKSHLHESRETVRDPIDTSAQERSGELSDKQFRQNGVSSDDLSSKDRTNTLDHISIAGSSTSRVPLPRFVEGTDDQFPEQPMPDFPVDIPLPNVVLEAEDSLEPSAAATKSLTNIPENIHNIIGEWSENGQPIRMGSRSTRERSRAVDVSPITSAQDRALENRQISSNSATSQFSGMSSEIRDLAARLETLWIDFPVVEFKQLCPVVGNTKKDASRLFIQLLELNKIQQVKLTQAIPYGAIYIQKYSPYF